MDRNRPTLWPERYLRALLALKLRSPNRHPRRPPPAPYNSTESSVPFRAVLNTLVIPVTLVPSCAYERQPMPLRSRSSKITVIDALQSMHILVIGALVCPMSRVITNKQPLATWPHLALQR